MGLITTISATALSAGLVAGGVHVAAASSASITLPSGGVLEQRVTHFCNRVPDLLKRADKAQTRLSGDPSTKGSIAWLQAKQDKAEKNKHPRVAKRLDRVIDRREKHLAKLPEIKTRLTKAQSECATLSLPQPSATATGS